jgi:SAM-dependent methyltransferase
MELSEHARRNRESWDADAEDYQRRHAGAIEHDAPHWGMWQLPESELGALGELDGREVLELGCGAGQFGLSLVRSGARVTGIDNSAKQLEFARANVGDRMKLVHGSAESLPFEDASFDLAGTLRTLHHVHRPELVVAELARVVRPGGRVLVIDQIAPADPLDARAVDRFEQARDPGHARLLPESDLRQLFEANRLALLRDRHDAEQRELAAYLDLAGCTGEARARTLELAPHGPTAYSVVVAWYLLELR